MNLTKTNRTKLIARVMLVILLLTNALSFVSCSEPNCQKDQYFEIPYVYDQFPLGLKAISDITEFSIDDITFELCIGLNNRGKFLNFNKVYKEDNSKMPYYSDHWCYVVYLLNYNDYEKILENNELLWNYAYILKEIPYREAVDSKEYYFMRSSFWGSYFNYCETITVPAKIFAEESETQLSQELFIGICMVEKSSETKEYISSAYDTLYINLGYSINNNIVTLYFSHRN